MNPSPDSTPAQAADPATDAPHSARASASEVRTSAPRLALTDFLDVESLQDVQDGFTAVTRLSTSIRDAEGNRVTSPTDATHRAQSDFLLEQLIEAEEDADGCFTAPIVVEGQVLGSIAIDRPTTIGSDPTPPEHRQRFRDAAAKLGLEDADLEKLVAAAEENFGPSRAASIQFLYLLANSIARLCYEEYHARQRLEELSALYNVSTVLSASRNLQQVINTAAHSVAEVMKVKAVSIRLLSQDNRRELVPRAVHNLSDAYMNKGTITLDDSKLFQDALSGQVVYIEDMKKDQRVLYREDAEREGLVSMLCTGMIFQGKPIGTVQLFTEELRSFSRFDVRLVRAIAQLLATAIENKRLDQQRQENQRMMRQLHLAADVQRRMMPAGAPDVPPFSVASRYVPSFELGGDFYDFFDLEGHLGVVVGDAVGKGVAASLLMASVRASLRAYAQDLYNMEEVLARVNAAVCRDTTDSEFATLWYGVLNPETRRLTYANAGHEPSLMLRDGQVTMLTAGGMIVGVDPRQTYDKGIVDLLPGDTLLLYTDGLPDAMNFEGQRFGRERLIHALKQCSDMSPADAVNHILWEMRRFTGIRRAHDDTSLVVIRVG